MERIYLFSGLGADQRIFAQLDLSGFEIIPIQWLKPRPAEAFESYVFRLAEHHQIPKQGSTVIGLSFGGICISELSKYYDFHKTVLISSAKTKDELPKVLSFSKLLAIHKKMPSPTQLKWANPIIYWFFGIKTDQEKKLLNDMMVDADPDFEQWAIDKIVHWDNVHVPQNCLHIHGDKDRLIPIQHVDYSIRIRGAGHFMVWNKATEISFHIRNFLL